MKRILSILILLIFIAYPSHAFNPLLVCSGGETASGGTETIGYESIGATSGGGSTGVLFITALDTASNSGTFQKILIYTSCSAASTTPIKVGIYEGATVSTATLVGNKAFSEPSYSAEWHEFDVSDQSWSATASNSYWLCFQVYTGSNWTFYYDTASSGDTNKTTTGGYGGAWPDPAGSTIALESIQSIKATIAY